MPTRRLLDDPPERQLRQACAELDRRLRAGELVRSEDLLTSFPAVAGHADSALELIYTEFVIREQLGQRPAAEEWFARFPRCREDLRELFQVHQLLSADTPADPAGTLPTPCPGGELTTMRDGGPAPASDRRRLGPYELLGEIARGGMGVVYKARQPGLDRIVALKVILAGAHAGPEELARFRTEAAAAAGLRHPNIVQIYEVGQADNGPYFSLEYVDGGSLQKHLADAPLPARPAAHLVEVLARAVEYAHQHGIVHRDLKPANVLLTADGTPKITDFGLAKRLEGGEADMTRTGAIVGTPSYMAPEQASGRTAEVGPAVDVYALGAILYETLTGRPPFRGETALDTLEQVRVQEPVAPRHLQAKVPRDLETICLKCLRKEPAWRYASSLGLAEDLRRWQAGEPVTARPVGLVERAVKWGRRRPALATLLAVSGAAVLSLLAVSLRYNALLFRALQTTRDREAEAIQAGGEAARNFANARRAVDRMIQEITKPHWRNEPRLEGRRRALLVEALTFYQDFLREKPGDPAVRLETARSYYRVGQSHAEMRGWPEATAAYESAIDLLEKLAAEVPTERQYRREWAMCLGFLGHVHRMEGRSREAEQLYLRAIALEEALLAATPDDPDTRRHLAAHLNNRCVELRRAGRYQEAEQGQSRALALQRAALAGRPQDVSLRSDLAISLHDMSLLVQQMRQPPDFQAAEAYCLQSLALRKQLTEELPGEVWHRYALGGTYVSLGDVLRGTARLAEAVPTYRLAESCLSPLVRDFPADPSYREQRARCGSGLAAALERGSQYAEAIPIYRQALADYEKLMAEDTRTPSYRHGVAANANSLAWLLGAAPGRPAGNPAEPLALAGKAVQLAPQNGAYLNTLATAQYRAGNWKLALETSTRAMALQGRNGYDLFLQAMAHRQLASGKEAQRAYDLGMKWMEKHKPTDPILRGLQTEAKALLDGGWASQTAHLSAMALHCKVQLQGNAAACKGRTTSSPRHEAPERGTSHALLGRAALAAQRQRQGPPAEHARGGRR